MKENDNLKKHVRYNESCKSGEEKTGQCAFKSVNDGSSSMAFSVVRDDVGYAFTPTEKKAKEAFTIVKPEMFHGSILQQEEKHNLGGKKIQWAFTMHPPENPEPGTAFTIIEHGAQSEAKSNDILKNVTTALPEKSGVIHEDIESGKIILKLTGLIRIYEGNSTDDTYLLKYSFHITHRYGESVVEVEESRIHDVTWIRDATRGLVRHCKDFDKIVSDALENVWNVPIKMIFLSTGWKSVNGEPHYVTDEGVLGRPIGDVCSKTNQFFQTDNRMVGSVKGAEEFLQMQNILRNSSVGKTLLLYVLMSVMTSLFETAHHPLRFLVALIGTTNSFKTSVAVVFSRIFDALTQDEPKISFVSTKGGIEKEMAKMEDAIFLIDDYMPADSKEESKIQLQKLKFLCRAFGDRIPKKRMSDYAKQLQESYPVRGCCLITGELFEGIASSQSRAFVIKLSRGDVNTEWLSYYQNNRLVLPSFVAGFISYLTENMNRVLRKISGDMSYYRTLTGFVVPRFRDMYGQFSIVAELFSDYLGNLGIRENADNWKVAVLKLIEEYQETFREDDVAKMVIKAFAEAIDINGLESVDNLMRGDPATKIYADSSRYYIRTEGLMEIATNFFGRQGKYFSLTKEQLILILREKEIIETWVNKKGNVESSRKLKQQKGIYNRYLYIKKEMVKAILEG